MARYRVLEAKYGVARGGMACGPVAGPVMAEIKLADENGDEFYLNLTEVDGIPNWFKTDRSTIEEQIEDKSEDVFEYLIVLNISVVVIIVYGFSCFLILPHAFQLLFLFLAQTVVLDTLFQDQ